MADASGVGCENLADRPRTDTTLNENCFCISLDRNSLIDAIVRDVGDPETSRLIETSRPHLFSDVSVYLSKPDLTRMCNVVSAIESAVQLPAYQTAVLSWAPEVARLDYGTMGVMMGYDFHITPDGPKLIEINTNAGGAFLNALLVAAQRTCCPEPARAQANSMARRFESGVVAMFNSEWKRQRGSGAPKCIAIVDDTPSAQYLYPEMILAKRLLQRNGIDAFVADPGELVLRDNRLYRGSELIDLVYNRLVDFSLDQPGHQVLRQAYLENAVVLTPGPRNHAIFADKRNLTLLSDAAFLRSLNLDKESTAVLGASVPIAVTVTPDNAEHLWKDRKQFFFKPATGYGSKGSYRGDKLTKGTWDAILKADYIAQKFAAPSHRVVKIDGALSVLKVDVRVYTYAGEMLLAAARIYQGQTTNFRTQGGGFAPLFTVG